MSFALASAHLLLRNTPSHHAGDEGDEGHEGHEEGHEAPRDEGCRGGCISDEGDESHEGDEGHEGYEEGNEGHEGNESHEGDEEVSGWKCMSLLLVGSGREQCECLELWRGSSPGSPVQPWGASHL